MKLKIYFRLLTRIFLVPVLFCFLYSGVSAQKTANWNPKKTWVFFVSLLEWKDSEEFESFPKENRRDLALLAVLRQKGVPETQIVALKDQTATIAKIQQAFQIFLKKVPADGSIFIYYSGHGYKTDSGETFLASYDAGIKTERSWSVKSIPKMIELYSKAKQVIIAIDSCYSGAIVDAIKGRKSNISYAAFVSTQSNSSSTGNWTFTESLIYGFRGDSLADRNRDGKITFGEMAANSYDDMLFAEEQLSQTFFTGDFSEQSQMTAAKKANSPRLGDRIEAFDGDEWYRAIITDARADGEYKVHFYGYEYDEDAFVTDKQIRTALKAKQYSVGEEVEVESDDEWYPARVLKVIGGAHLVSYDHYSEEWNEWVSSDKIRSKSEIKSSVQHAAGN
ncbi:MAG TPA: agenet domain-containing protein [Pyrinomonadaceae bacterium]|jgi:hypothetical protein